jgi:hypothetical protein
MENLFGLLCDDDVLPAIPPRSVRPQTSLDQFISDNDCFHISARNAVEVAKASISECNYGELLDDDDVLFLKMNPKILDDSWDAFSTAGSELSVSISAATNSFISTDSATQISDSNTLLEVSGPLSRSEMEVETNTAIRASDSAMKLRAMSQNFFVVQQSFTCKCIGNGAKNCLGKLTLGDICELRESFWGEQSESAPTSSERKNKMYHILTHATRGDRFEFFVGKAQICEAGYLTALGLSSASPPRMWRETKKDVIDGKLPVDKEITASPRWRLQFQHAQNYQLRVINSECDDDPEILCKILPYVYASQFYAEYKYHYSCLTISGEVSTEDIASEKTFGRALRELIGTSRNCICSESNTL